MKIGLDIMGGDNSPQAMLDGAVIASRLLDKKFSIVLFGNQEVIRSYLKEKRVDSSKFEIVNCDEAIGMEENPTKSLELKSNSTINVGLYHLEKKKIDAFLSAGNSGALSLGAIQILGIIEGIIRPCTSILIPQEDNTDTLLIDVGISPDAKKDSLFQFGLIGSIFMKYVKNIENPRVKLLNIGEESGKGNILYKSAFDLMNDNTKYNFCGNIESRDLLRGKADVVVCDGFTGNIVLKQIESFYYLLKKRKKLDDYFMKLNYEYFGGIPILGVNGLVMVGHGISNEKAICNMILNSMNISSSDFISKISTATEYLKTNIEN